MVTGRDVVDRAGRVLVPAGTRLDERHLRVLKTWGIDAVEVEVGAPPPSAARGLPPEERERVRARFRRADLAHPLVAELLEQALLRASGGDGRGAGGADVA
jgi:hypothetical protein